MALASLRHLRFNTHQRLLRLVQGRVRRHRLKVFLDRLAVRPSDRVLDLGGRPELWNLVPWRLEVTILNLPGTTGHEVASHHQLRFVEGDACAALEDWRDGEFDVVFSNSVIEHVGDEARQAAFARNARRLGRRYWVQTPAPGFPLEAHTGMPFWWLYPEPLRAACIRRWRRTLPSWAEDVAQTRVLSRDRMRALFPDARMFVETFAGLPKSYSAYRAG